MKKCTVYLAVLSMATLLVACSPKKETPATQPTTKQSQTTQTTVAPAAVTQATEETTIAPAETSQEVTETSTTTSTPTVSDTTGMNLEAIAQGDYSSIVGTWQTQNSPAITFTPSGVAVESGLKIGNSKKGNGVVELSMATAEGYGFALLLVPRGTAIPQEYFHEGTDTTDINQDRLIGTQSLLNGNDLSVYYLVNGN